MTIELKAEAVRLFAEIGFLGLGRGRTAEAETIFEMLRALRPSEEAGAVGSAMAALAVNRPDSAIKLLKAAEQTPAVMAFSALAHARLGESALARALVEDLEAMGAEPALLDMAQGALGRA
jgi:predicted Zn-dependent protease